MSKAPRKGRGATIDPANRFHEQLSVPVDDGWYREAPNKVVTSLSVDNSRSIINYNKSPDVPFDRSINPYRGCEHGCIYCYARPTHAYLDLSPGLDFESKLFVKPKAADQLYQALSKPGYRAAPLALGANTDAYQPVERQQKITRQILKVLHKLKHPVVIVTKSSLVERDIDILSEMAADGLAQVAMSITTLNAGIARHMEPRAATPNKRLETMGKLTDAGIPTHLMIAPLVPMLTDNELELIMQRSRDMGASSCSYVLLRLPLEVDELFLDWLVTYYPDRAERIMNRIRDCHQGENYRSEFGERQTGSGIFADLIGRRFTLAQKKLGYRAPKPLRCDLFCPPGQMDLF